MLKLKVQYFGDLMRTLEKFLMMGKIEVRRRRGNQRMRWLDINTEATNMNLGKQTPGGGEGQRVLACCSPCGCQESDLTG